MEIGIREGFVPFEFSNGRQIITLISILSYIYSLQKKGKPFICLLCFHQLFIYGMILIGHYLF